jgi:1-acyl-sn-glycerol-3-phosphate acyltransferase
VSEAPLTEPRSAAPAGPPFQVLRPFERFAFKVMRWFNQAGGAAWGARFQRLILEPFFGLFLSRRLVVRGLERLGTIPPGASVLLVANHRTFFDQFVLGFVLRTQMGMRGKVSFPVRANFFYEGPLGLLVCLLLSAGSMFPPFFRRGEAMPFNKYSLSLVIEMLRGGYLVGFHPEGTRNKGPDIYDLLPAQPGAGEVALKARPIVLPAFISGLSNKLLRELRSNLRRTNPIVMVFGEPVDLSRFPAETRLSHHKKCADLFRERIAALIPEEKAVRAELSAASPERGLPGR